MCAIATLELGDHVARDPPEHGELIIVPRIDEETLVDAQRSVLRYHVLEGVDRRVVVIRLKRGGTHRPRDLCDARVNPAHVSSL
jgi:hypothetical protein